MRLCIIYHSETGNTRHVAQHIASACDGRLVEVYDRAQYSALTRFFVRCKRAHGEEMNPVEPASIDVTGYDVVAFGSPVWAYRPTPVIHAAIDGLAGCEGKTAVAFFTHGGKPGQSEEVIKKWIESRGMRFAGAYGITAKQVEDEIENAELVKIVKAAQRAPG
jgi:multimeric flavodoxin WrbA